METTKKQQSSRLLIEHPRIPYTVVPALPVLEDDPVCAVALTGGFFRVLHIKSGVTLTDVKTIAAARSFVNRVRAKYKVKKFKELLDATRWDQFCKGKDTDSFELSQHLEPLRSSRLHVPKSVTKNERYLYSPEPR
jgi:hypothetical protein